MDEARRMQSIQPLPEGMGRLNAKTAKGRKIREGEQQPIALELRKSGTHYLSSRLCVRPIPIRFSRQAAEPQSFRFQLSRLPHPVIQRWKSGKREGGIGGSPRETDASSRQALLPVPCTLCLFSYTLPSLAPSRLCVRPISIDLSRHAAKPQSSRSQSFRFQLSGLPHSAIGRRES